MRGLIPGLRKVQPLLASAGGAAIAPPLDGVSDITGAWSLRKLLTSYASNAARLRRSSDDTEQSFAFSGNDFDATGAATFIGGGSGLCRTLFDQSGNGRDLTQTTNANQATYTASGANGRSGLSSAANDKFLVSGAAASSFFTAAAYTAIAVFKTDGVSTNAANSWDNAAVWADVGQFIGLHLKSTQTALAYNWESGGDTHADIALANSTYAVIVTRHAGGNLYISKNGGSETSVASGNTISLANTIRVGTNTAGITMNGILHELIFSNVSLASATIAAIVANQMSYYGIS